jgi:hypothetical protein
VGHRTGPVHCPVRHLAPTLTSARAVALFTVHCRLLQTTVGAVSRCSAGTPDSPVNYSGEPFSETRSLSVGGNSPWCTGQSGAPDQGCFRLSFALFI